MKKQVISVVALLGLTGCFGVDRYVAEYDAANLSPYHTALYEGYSALADKEEYTHRDWADAEYFQNKANTASQGVDVIPAGTQGFDEDALLENPDYRKVPSELIAQAGEFREKALRFSSENRETNPIGAAKAIVAADACLEELEEANNASSISEACSFEYVRLVEESVTIPGDPQPTRFVIYFEFDKSTITPTAREILKYAAELANKRGTHMAISSHTDKSGSTAYNVALSKRRANSTEAALEALGVEASRIQPSFDGEGRPAVQTKDGVREQLNRRTEIVVY